LRWRNDGLRAACDKSAMLDTLSLDPEMTTDALMRRWPTTIPVLIQHGMLCVGCPIAGFHTLTEACVQHGVEFHGFIAALKATIAAEVAK
jgi:hybrid cluster-associated redox disulfide protein